jgi:hypothetical protein
MKHKEKVKMARKMQTKTEAKIKGEGIFLSKAWKKRKEDKANKLNNK